jgi:hypothetical protein
MTQYHEAPGTPEAKHLLAQWLTANSADPCSPWTAAGLASWRLHPIEEWFLAEPPGYANRLFLVSPQLVYSFAPSNESVEDALEAARRLGQGSAR